MTNQSPSPAPVAWPADFEPPYTLAAPVAEKGMRPEVSGEELEAISRIIRIGRCENPRREPGTGKEVFPTTYLHDCGKCDSCLAHSGLAALAGSAGGGWQPMETAPKDQPILLIAKGQAAGRDDGQIRLGIWHTWPGGQTGWRDLHFNDALNPTAWTPIPFVGLAVEAGKKAT